MSILKSFLLFAVFLYLVWVLKPSEEYYFLHLPGEEAVSKMHRAYEEGKLEEAKTYAMFIISSDQYSQEAKEEAQRVQKEVEEKLNNFGYRAQKCAKAVLSGVPGSMDELFCVFISDLTIFGDVRDLVMQGIKKFRGEEPDWFVAGLSALGLANPTFDLFRALWKTGGLSKPMAELIAKERKLEAIQEIQKLSDTFKHLGVGYAPFARSLRYVNNKTELENFKALVQKEGPVKAYVAVVKSEGKVLKKSYRVVFYNSVNDLVRVAIKDLKKGGPVLVDYLTNKISEFLKVSKGVAYALLFSLSYALVSIITPFRNFGATLGFGLVLFAVALWRF